METNFYDEFWLRIDARNTGFLFEYCEKVMKSQYNIDINIDKFLTTFMNSNVRQKMDAGHPRLLSQSYEDTIECFITVDCDGDYHQFGLNESETIDEYHHLEKLWIGRMYVLMAYQFGISFLKLVEKIPFRQMRLHYRTGHEINDTIYLDSVAHIFAQL